ncbi:MAG: hypothetical protein J0I34_24705 [Pseudonocardia sp.]|uniref:DUF7144 family membrane protein n=1 Tax=unclassified Pseudonocardia TaxID=2619320 RepID=UPI00086A0C22|nr:MULTISPECIES: hypothetical protein [unclassified Pseudonocardia]MBN9111970.1 hypothetical protein [Pseudonocardia sp.]ODU24029.1 MAG: hypothetical protein ABS80_13550 [Pseudonocardia sp. SCN 72-51]ODV06098.1 MAG: hypothetical protein ABT15_14935 [Pseudonocardia sp. SCN 73-27]
MTTRAQDTYTTTAPAESSAQKGLVLFGGLMMILCGVYHALSGVSAILKDQVYLTTPNYTFEFDLTAWGWVHLILGVILIATGIAVVRGVTWGAIVGIALAGLSLVANFMFLPHYPLWSILIIAIDVAIIYALVARLRNG